MECLHCTSGKQIQEQKMCPFQETLLFMNDGYMLYLTLVKVNSSALNNAEIMTTNSHVCIDTYAWEKIFW